MNEKDKLNNNNDPNNNGENGNNGKTPTIDELTVQLAKANADLARYKNSIDALTKENAEKKRLLQEKMTAEEQEAAAKKEAEEKAKAHTAELEKKLAIYESKARYIGLGMDATMAEETANAEYDHDMKTVTENFQKLQAAALKNARAEWIKSRPDINAGGDDEKTEDEKIHDAFFSVM